jgi:hypothetical protein
VADAALTGAGENATSAPNTAKQAKYLIINFSKGELPPPS